MKEPGKDPLDIAIGITIRTKRNRLGLTIEQLAGYSDTEVSYISEIENGKRNISTQKLMNLAAGLNLDDPTILLKEAVKDVYPSIREKLDENRE
ncbi:helix-turn-helix domain-containing protein [Alkalihalophilus sp. As8PL]|uniref:Helix-turn-helix domain-containing protein n=1 Tax=Alkalihalophilus sp. As8PL TaxID=3237103 RepID=A0AB39BVJ8_9BACI